LKCAQDFWNTLYIRSSGNYRSIKLLDYELKVIATVLEKRLRSFVKLEEIQMGFMPGKGTIDATLMIDR